MPLAAEDYVLATNGTPPDHQRPTALRDRLLKAVSRAVVRAKAALWWERAWPRIALILAVIALFVALTWLGLWQVVTDMVRLALLAVFAGGIGAILVSLFRVQRPGRAEALARIEIRSGHLHRPVTALTDVLGAGARDPASQALWQRHQERAAADLKQLSAGTPKPKFYRFDPWALRVPLAMLLVIGFGVAGPDRWARLANAFSFTSTEAVANFRLDAWVDPPAYTGRVPIFLTRDPDGTGPKAKALSVPQGSTVIARIQGSGDYAIHFEPDAAPAPTAAADDAAPADDAVAVAADPNKPTEFRLELTGSGSVRVTDGDSTVVTWRFDTEPDALPVITLTAAPEPTVSRALKLAYSITDDYGVVGAEATMTSATPRQEGAPEPLVPAPKFPLTLPKRGAREQTGETIRDLTAHPWAGSEVLLTLAARDVAGQTGTSEATRITLPARYFSKPLARAIVEQRRTLALDRRDRHHVADSLDALMIAPDQFIDNASVYLGMRFAYGSLIAAETDDELREVVDLLWTLALSIEDGELSLAMRQLREAQEALRQALENGASDEEIRKLTEQLRAAMENFFNALSEQARRNPQAMMPMDPNARMLSQRDMQSMLDRIEELARSGSRESAQQLLSQMQQMLENLQTGQMQQAPGQQGQELSKMLDQLGEMIRRQRELMDQTHRFNQQQQGQQGQRQDDQSQRGQQFGELQQGQNELRQQLEEMMRRMQELGMQPGDQLGEAGKSMGEAGKALGQSQGERALGNQGDALNALREGADQMIEQMMAQGRGQGGRMGQNPNDDPLGRPRQTDGPTIDGRTKIPSEIDVQRARRILEELRRRLSDPSRPRLELDYLERLIPRN